jgi:ketosteroid isomerase-like protein
MSASTYPRSCSTRPLSSFSRSSATAESSGTRRHAGNHAPYWETFEDFHYEIEEVIHADETHVIAAVRDGGRMKGSDAEVWTRFFDVVTFRNGKVLRLSAHLDKNRALEAAGLRE